MVDVVGAEAGAHQLLEEVGLLVRALGGAETREREPVFVADLLQAGGSEVEGFFPARFTKRFLPVRWIDHKAGFFFYI